MLNVDKFPIWIAWFWNDHCYYYYYSDTPPMFTYWFNFFFKEILSVNLHTVIINKIWYNFKETNVAINVNVYNKIALLHLCFLLLNNYLAFGNKNGWGVRLTFVYSEYVCKQIVRTFLFRIRRFLRFESCKCIGCCNMILQSISRNS